MSTGRSGFWMPLGIVILAWLLLLYSAASPAQTEDGCRPPLKARFLQVRNQLQASQWNGIWSLTYKYQLRNLATEERTISCRIDGAGDQRLRDAFGLYHCENLEHDSRSLDGHAACKCRSGGDIVPLCSQKKEYDEYLKRRGMRLVQERYIPDYPHLAVEAAGTVQDCAHALRERLGDKEAEWLAFFQALRPDDDERSLHVPEVEIGPKGEKWTAGLLVPTDVLIRNRGDCDSKALAFLSLQDNREADWMLFRSTKLDCASADQEGHALLAILQGSSPRPMRFNPEEVLELRIDHTVVNRETFNLQVRAGVLLEYSLMDLTGPGMTLLGELDPQKYGMYIGLPIETGGRAKMSKRR